MHAYVNGVPKNDHNITVAEQLYFQFSVAKNEKLKVHKCQRFPARSWITICPTQMMIMIMIMVVVVVKHLLL